MYAENLGMRIFVTGGTGLIGRRLVPRLTDRGDQAVVLSRSSVGGRFDDAGVVAVQGDPTQPGEWQASLAECDAAVNLAGENIMARRWNAEHKRRIRDSRIQATRRVVEAIGQSGGRCKTLVNGSAIGYYGSRGDERLEESAGPGRDFLADVCTAWEAEAEPATQHGARVVCVRTGAVLDPAGGALAQMLPMFRRFLGGPVGSGRQWFSWIHYADLVGLFCLALDDQEVSGPINGTSPNPVTNRQFARALGRALRRPSLCRAPTRVLRLALGEAADVVLASQRVVPQVALNRGYPFQFGQLDAALADLIA